MDGGRAGVLPAEGIHGAQALSALPSEKQRAQSRETVRTEPLRSMARRWQWLKDDLGRIQGLAIFLRKPGAVVAAGYDWQGRAWRICDRCGERRAFVYCRSHVQYLCGICIPWHQTEQGGRCESLISVALVRRIAQKAEVGWP